MKKNLDIIFTIPLFNGLPEDQIVAMKICMDQPVVLAVPRQSSVDRSCLCSMWSGRHRKVGVTSRFLQDR